MFVRTVFILKSIQSLNKYQKILLAKYLTNENIMVKVLKF